MLDDFFLPLWNYMESIIPILGGRQTTLFLEVNSNSVMLSYGQFLIAKHGVRSFCYWNSNISFLETSIRFQVSFEGLGCE